MNVEAAGQRQKEAQTAPKLKRVLGLWDLIFYGIVLNQPVAAVGLFGLVSQISRGHMVTTLLLSMVAMLLTAVSYGRMAALYPSAGSAYTYVGRGLKSPFGFYGRMGNVFMLSDYTHNKHSIWSSFVPEIVPRDSIYCRGNNFCADYYYPEFTWCPHWYESQ